MRKYWVQFKIIDGKQVGDGVMELNREFPICGERDVQEMSAAVKKALQQQGLPETAAVQVMSWTKFEEERLLLATEMPPSPQSQRVSLSH